MENHKKLPRKIVLDVGRLQHCLICLTEELWDRKTGDDYWQKGIDRSRKPHSFEDLRYWDRELRKLGKIPWWKRRDWLAASNEEVSVALGWRLSAIATAARHHELVRLSPKLFPAFQFLGELESGDGLSEHPEIEELMRTTVYCEWLARGGSPDLGRWLARYYEDVLSEDESLES